MANTKFLLMVIAIRIYELTELKVCLHKIYMYLSMLMFCSYATSNNEFY